MSETTTAPQSDKPVETLVLSDEERTPCEIWSRVMGYHRPVHYWNRGKQQEFADRKCFREPPL